MSTCTELLYTIYSKLIKVRRLCGCCNTMLSTPPPPPLGVDTAVPHTSSVMNSW